VACKPVPWGPDAILAHGWGACTFQLHGISGTMRLTGKLVGWLAILLVGHIVITVLTNSMAQSGAGLGTGVLSYWFRAQFQVWHGPDRGDSMIGSITVESRHPARFKLWGNSSPRYRHSEIDWFLYNRERSEGKAEIDLGNLQIVQGGNAVSLDSANLLRLFGISDPTEDDTLVVEALVEFFESAREGRLPRPNHHGHRLSEPLPGWMQHFAIGLAIQPMGMIWLVSWTWFGIQGLLCELREKRDRKRKA